MRILRLFRGVPQDRRTRLFLVVNFQLKTKNYPQNRVQDSEGSLCPSFLIVKQLAN